MHDYYSLPDLPEKNPIRRDQCLSTLLFRALQANRFGGEWASGGHKLPAALSEDDFFSEEMENLINRGLDDA